jgi:FkbM family methyltransferase
VSAGRIEPSEIARELASLGSARLVLVDAGAAAGVPRRWRPVERHLLVVGFEPDERSYAALEPGEGRAWLKSALWERPETVEIHLARKAQNSSVFVPNREFLARFPDPERFEVTGSARVEATTLDDALTAAGIARADFLKADVQGAELAVLRGARSTLAAGLYGVEAEVAFAPLYRGQPMFGEIDQLLREEGFELIDLRRVYWKTDRYAETRGAKGRLVAGDALYLRGAGTFLPLVDRSGPEPAQAAIVNALVTCAVYGHPSLGLELLDEASEAALLDPEVAAGARALLGARPRFGVQRLPAPLRPRAARVAGAIGRSAERVRNGSRRFAPAGGWPPSAKRRGRHGDGELGNP